MKKTIKLILLVCLVLSLCTLMLTACDKEEKPSDTTDDTTDDAGSNEEHVHAFGDWTVTKEANCTENGEKERVCACGEKEVLGIESLGHIKVVDPATAPTCTTEGKTEGEHCSTCGLVFVEQTSIPVVDHTYDNDEDEKCNVCDFIRDVDCKHTKTEVLKAVSATCTASGLTEGKKCSKCGEILVAQKTVSKLGHKEETDKAVHATCTTDGKTEGKHCSRCNVVLVAQTTVNKLGHTEVLDNAVEPTCAKEGKTEGSHCSRCNKTLVAQKKIDKLPHTEVIDEAVAATCTKTGLTEGKHCAVCDTVIKKQSTVSATGHNFQNDQCTYCGKVNKTRFTNELAARYSADEKNGYSIWWSFDDKYYCVDYDGYKTFMFDENEKNLSNVYNSAVITEIGQKQRLRSAVDGKILFTTENAVNMEILIPYYNENKFFRDGYIFVYTKTEAYNGVTYEIGFINPQGEWIVPLSKSNPILETINDEATVQYFYKSLRYCGEGMMSFGVNDKYYLYNIEKNTVCRILNNGKPSNNDVRITLSCGISFKDGYSVESYGYGVGYYKLYTDGTMERINIDFHDDCHEREGYAYFDRTQNRYIAIGYTYGVEGFSIFDSKGSIIKRITDVNLVATEGFFSNGTAPIILGNKEGTTYYTILDIDGNFLFDPVKINTNTVCDIYGNEVYISLSSGGNYYTIIDNSGNILLETGFVYDFGMNNGVVSYKEKYNGDKIYVEYALR